MGKRSTTILCKKANLCFEVHLTVDVKNNQQDFVKICQKLAAKPLEIILAIGEYPQQMMLSKTVSATNLDEVLDITCVWKTQFLEVGIATVRTKIEVPFSKHQDAIYHEWHGRVAYERIDELKTLCKISGVHLSHNALKMHTQDRFLTLRDHNAFNFEARLLKLKQALQVQNRVLKKQQHESCIYDDCIQLDKGWILPC